jgi:hypothetical protein
LPIPTGRRSIHPERQFYLFSYLISVDYASVNAAVGLILNVVHGYANGKPDIISLLKYKTIWVVPILNVDALEFLLDFYKKRNSVTFIYKNRKEDNYTNEDKCGRNGLGVNLNKKFYCRVQS